MKSKLEQAVGRRGAEGSAMMAVMSISMLSAVIVAGLSGMALQWGSSTRMVSDYHRAFAIAEAGPADAFTQLSVNWSLTEDPTAFGPVEFGGGTYENTVTVTNEQVLIRCVGRFRGASAEVATLFSRSFETNPPPPASFVDDWVPSITGPGPTSPYDYAILANGEVQWGGTAGSHAPGAWVHANQQVYLYGTGDLWGNASSATRIYTQGGACLLTGDAHAPVITGKPGVNVTGNKVVGPVAPIQIPQINFEPYRAWAQAHGEYFTGTKQIGSSYQPNGGVLFVDGVLQLNGGTLVGCFVATGDIHVSAQVRHSSLEGLPALMTDAGSIRINGGAHLQGLVYARTGNLDKLNGNAKLRGAVICGGNVIANGTFDFFYEACRPSPPWMDSDESGSESGSGGEGDPIARLRFLGWQM